MARRRAMTMAAPARFAYGGGGKLLRQLLALAGVMVLVVAGVGIFITYRIVTSKNVTEIVTPQSSFLSNYESLSFTDRKGEEHEGWFLVGLKGAPVIVLTPSYNSNRSELLSLGGVLRQNHFNVYVYNPRGVRTKQKYSDLGIRQSEDLLAALEAIMKLPGVNPRRAGLYGITTGGYASLLAAQQSPVVKAVVVDSAYDSPMQMLDAQVDDFLGGSSRQFRLLPRGVFRLLTFRTPRPEVQAGLSKLANIPKLLIQGEDSAVLAAATGELYALAPPPKQMLVMDQSYTALASGAVKKEYENQVLNFFLQNLPLRAD
jgi:pimeloyl-ACP methyl ester carboxylesterase